MMDQLIMIIQRRNLNLKIQRVSIVVTLFERKIIKMSNTVYIVVDGGCVQGVFTEKDADVCVILVDHDNRKVADDEERLEIQADADLIDAGLKDGTLKEIF
jgi:L-lactate utilization protein LutB